MKISLNWLRDYVRLEAPIDEITRAITFLGFEVENVVSTWHRTCRRWVTKVADDHMLCMRSIGLAIFG